jgi:hypothetical protein
MAGTIICDRIESDASFPSSINIASPMIVSNTITMGSAASISGDVNFDSGTLFVDSINNRVGVGTNTPVNNLHINGNFAIAKIQSTTNSGAQLRFENTQTSSTGFVVGLGGSTEGDGIIYHQDNKPISFFTNADERMRINSAGQVLIGTTTGVGNLVAQKSSGIRNNENNGCYTTVIAIPGSATATIGTFSGNAGATAVVILRGGHHFGTVFTPGSMQMYQKMAIVRVSGDGTLLADNNQTVFVRTTGSGPAEPTLSFNTSTGVLTVSTAANQGCVGTVEVVWGSSTANFTPA